MKYKVLGKSGLNVSVIGFGGIPVQRVDIETVRDVIKKSEELGINFIDSARGYGVSEQYIGEALEGRRNKWILATKSMARDKDAMSRDIEESLKNFKTEYIDLYQIHNVKSKEDLENVLKDDGAYAALVEAKKMGKINHIGITSHSLDVLNCAIEMGIFETIMYPYNIVENQGEELFKRATELNIGTIVMKPMAGGAIQNGTLALKYILNNENITVAIPGMADIKEIEENAKVGSSQFDLSDEEIDEANNIKKELGSEFCRRCSYCMPCSKGIDIPTQFILSGYKERYGLENWAEERYATLKANASDCIQCGVCESKCPYELPIRKMLKNVEKVFGK